jgi:murein DD-endopeptidase MepM/ murein hydrolase activator NlpD
MLAVRRPLLVAAVTLVAMLAALPATAATADDLQVAKHRLAAARDAAVDARSATYDAEEKLHITEDRIADLEQSIDQLEQRAAELRAIVRERALYAYTHAGSNIDIVIGTDSPLSAARGKTLIDLSNQKDHTAARKLAVINNDLKDQTTQLREQETRQRTVRDQLASRNAEFEAALDDAQSAAGVLQVQYDREIAELTAKQAAETEARQQAQLEAQLEQLQRERAVLALAQPVANPATADLSPGQVVANPAVAAPDAGASASPAPSPPATSEPEPAPTPATTPEPAPEPTPAPSPAPTPAPSGGFMCPVFGATYTDDFGGARGHGGIDMFVPEGTPLYATVSGSVRYVANEGAGGNTVYLNGNGNSYFYAHLSQFVGGARSVSQGEIIGYSGMTGNATGPHLHFEIRVGGDNGTKVNPYPTLRGAGC